MPGLYSLPTVYLRYLFLCHRGHNGYCQLGNGSTAQCFTPTLIEGAIQGKFVTDVACGSHHSLCLTKDGDIYAWGQNNCGQIGTGTTTNQSTPRKVSSPFAGKKVRRHGYK